MRGTLLLCVLTLLCGTLFAQKPPVIYKIPADSVLLSYCDSTELIIENHTQNVPGFLYNTGRGRTMFKRGAQKLNDSMYLVGADTVNLGARAWIQGGNSFGATGVIGTLDNNPLDFYVNGVKQMRLNDLGQLRFDYPDNNGAYPIVASNSNYTYPWFSVFGNTDMGVLALGPNNSAFNGPNFVIKVGYTDTIETSLYAGLTIRGNDGIDLQGGYGSGAGSSRWIRFFTVYPYPVAEFGAHGGLVIGGNTAMDYGNSLQVNGAANIAQLGIQVASPTATLHTNGSIRFQGLTSDASQTQILVIDTAGNLFYRDASTLAANDVIHSSLAVNGPITAKQLTLSAKDWPDYVFDSSYKLPALNGVDAYIRQHHHLQGFPAANEIEKNRLDVGKTQSALLKKIEELTLYTITQDKQLTDQQKQIDDLKARLEKLEKLIK
jgi:hypothetical protein